MVLGLKLMGKLTTRDKYLSVRQNQGIAWSSNSNLWENQLLKKLGFGQNQGIAWSSDSNLWRNQPLKENSRFAQTYGMTTY